MGVRSGGSRLVFLNFVRLLLLCFASVRFFCSYLHPLGLLGILSVQASLEEVGEREVRSKKR